VDRRIPASARALVDSESPRICPIVELELTYLHEIGRVSEPASAPLSALGRSIGLQPSDASFEQVARAAVDLTWARDPFDRLIAAHAIAAGAPLLTADKSILENLPLATWG
jgi:PIN domain nuclease of toxin-antitoxin system